MKKGKILLVGYDEYFFSRGHRIYKCNITDGKQSFLTAVKNGIYTYFSANKYLRRLTRSELFGLYELGKEFIILAKKGIFVYDSASNNIYKSLDIQRGSKPLNLCVLPNGHLFFGEYFQNMEKEAVNIYRSSDNGHSWQVAFTFAAGEINHIHGVFFDKFASRIWVVTGDRENECIIGYTEDEFESFHECLRGGQEYRTCQLYFYPEYIVYATDSQYIQNKVKCINRETLVIKDIQDIQGSAIKGGQVGNLSFLSTTVEPSDVNTDKYAHIWISKDGLHWEERYKAKKDNMPSLFQFGTFEFPQYKDLSMIDTLYFNGRALQGCDGIINQFVI